MDNAVERATTYMWERYCEPLSLRDIAAGARLSQFYFARLFRDATGVTPGRFLAAVRIFQAKTMLQSTVMTVADVAHAVGYNSLGSFTNHFTRSVGVSPSRFRRLAPTGGFGYPPVERGAAPDCGTVAGTISLPAGHPGGCVYVGAFRGPILEHRPGAAVVAHLAGGSPAAYRLPDVPAGPWYVHAVPLSGGAGPGLPGLPGLPGQAGQAHRARLTGGRHPVTVTAGIVTRAAVGLRPGRPADPPVLLALPDRARCVRVRILPG